MCISPQTCFLPELWVEVLGVCVELELLREYASESLGIWLGSFFIWSPRSETGSKQREQCIKIRTKAVLPRCIS